MCNCEHTPWISWTARNGDAKDEEQQQLFVERQNHETYAAYCSGSSSSRNGRSIIAAQHVVIQEKGSVTRPTSHDPTLLSGVLSPLSGACWSPLAPDKILSEVTAIRQRRRRALSYKINTWRASRVVSDGVPQRRLTRCLGAASAAGTDTNGEACVGIFNVRRSLKSWKLRTGCDGRSAKLFWPKQNSFKTVLKLFETVCFLFQFHFVVRTV